MLTRVSVAEQQEHNERRSNLNLERGEVKTN